MGQKNTRGTVRYSPETRQDAVGTVERLGGDKSPSDGIYPFTKELTEADQLPEPFHNNHCYNVKIFTSRLVHAVCQVILHVL